MRHNSIGFGREFRLTEAPILPDPAVCRARDSGLASYTDCLVQHAFACPHAMRFGEGFFCQHPQRHEMVPGAAPRQHGDVWG